MGYRGKVADQERARELRAEGLTLVEIAAAVGAHRSAIGKWVRDVEFEPRPGSRARKGRPGSHTVSKQAEIERLMSEGATRIGRLSERDFLIAGVALYAGEGSKTDGEVRFANSDPRMILFFITWLRHFFDIDESRLRFRLYLHEGLDLEAANRFWSELTGIPVSQFHRPYRAVPDPSIRKAKHVHGCPCVVYCSSAHHRMIMGLIAALLSSPCLPG